MAGKIRLGLPFRDSHWIRKLYEKAVAGFYRVTLSHHGWRVSSGKTISWPVSNGSEGVDRVLPKMEMDIVLDHPATSRRIVIDTKFTSIFTNTQYRTDILKSGYLYQIYSYLRSQEGNDDPFADNASGILLHPSIDVMVDETAMIQGHSIRFSTVNLSASSEMIRQQLLYFIAPFSPINNDRKIHIEENDNAIK
jgi:5-methylcytosine-specific restriction enzyme subunit McrC